MYIKNLTSNDIGPIAYEGYNFTIPANKVSAIWDKVGKVITTEIYKIEAKDVAVDQGAPLPPVMEAEAKDWDGKTYATVTRFQIDPSRIGSRGDVIRIAKQRGVEKEWLDAAQVEGAEIDNDEIVRKVNSLPIPEEVRIPVIAPEAQTEESANQLSV